MSPEINGWLHLVFRWLHVLAGVMWIGHLWFFNFVNGQVAKTYDADTKKKVVPELMPRALYWFRWGAAYTWVTGILLLAFVYYMGGTLLPDNPKLGTGLGSIVGLAVLVVAFLVYDILWKALAKKEMVGAIISWAATVGIAFGLAQIFTGRATLIHIGAMFGTIMAANVWMRIWPNQRKIIAATKAGTAPDAALASMAGLRSKHNTYMSFPLIFFMVSNHFATFVYGTSNDAVMVPIFVAVFVAVGWALTKFCYNKAGTKAPAQYEPAGAAVAPAAAADKK